MRRSLLPVVAALLVALPSTSGTAAAENISAYVAEIDEEASCLEVDWDNDSRRRVCWSDATTITELESGDARSASDIHIGSYLFVDGEEQEDGTLAATAIEIWEAAPPPEAE